MARIVSQIGESLGAAVSATVAKNELSSRHGQRELSAAVMALVGVLQTYGYDVTQLHSIALQLKVRSEETADGQ